ncbi:efflux RND transporter periplasmic adaptor subunit [Candidatus Berkiella aquae]|uniref:Cation efflux system protein CusB n=1 Tax=Candidatus Berkiella aquae TaxID=295108 RepID=A0A0Q9YI40_9GAMM|nr:efflux RND transporter periplasmic adaptor subunit [Candidatus Berkiella aquae]MCS5712800.1 efflux RND transporter periplasmic adaptor subunit [Candidatus Berkiella aquae]
MKRGLLAIIITVAVILGVVLGYYLKIDLPLEKVKSNQTSSVKALYWIDPMEPQVHYPGPGKSHMGMELVPVYEEKKEGKQEKDGSIRISPAIVENLGVRTAQVERGTLTRQIETVGYVVPNENNISHIHAYAEGWIRKLVVRAMGEPVKQGQLLVQLYSPILIGAQKEFLLALRGDDKSLIEAAYHKLQSFKISEEQITRIRKSQQAEQLVDMFSPIDGVIAELNVREGMWVAPETEIMSLVDLTSVWIMVQIFEQQAGWVTKGQEAKAKLPAFPSQEWKGKVEYVYPEVDAATRTLKVRFIFDNPHHMLKPNMYANVILLVSPKENVLSIPTEALIRHSKGDRVIVALGEGRFLARSVTTGIETSDRIEIVSGLKEGEQVVTSGQFLIDSEANLKASTQRISSQNENSSISTLSVEGIGIVQSMNVKQHIITLKHEAIAALDMQEMTMDFVVNENISLSTIKVGERIRFIVEKDPMHQFVITKISPIDEASP